ncbi:hypothetical protein H5410_017866 [Solanum commersonii]|uniref:Uncharacterized protein n=1 Tax=Solanum commersonii TaxID=4109 RepID=A0A9J6A180_SOLCO|nr:hypothetical protein H5410_017866 [Solanum commersonii]
MTCLPCKHVLLSATMYVINHGHAHSPSSTLYNSI